MTFLEKMKNGELYDCSFDAVPEELNKKLYECKELIDKSKNFFTKKSNLFFTTNQTNIPINPFSYNFYH